MTQELSWPGTIFDVTVGIHSHEAHVLVLTTHEELSYSNQMCHSTSFRQNLLHFTQNIKNLIMPKKIQLLESDRVQLKRKAG